LPPAETRSVSQAEPEIFAFSYDVLDFSPYTWRYFDCHVSLRVEACSLKAGRQVEQTSITP
jgi:hypothetical protein